MTSNNLPVAFVTGAASGIGHAVAVELARTHAVIGVDRSSDGLEKTRALILEGGGRCEARTADVTDFATLQAAISEGESALGTVTAAVACAGIDVRGTAADTDFYDWNRSLSVNLTGVFATAEAVLPSLLASRGSFTAIASDAGTSGAQGTLIYRSQARGGGSHPLHGHGLRSLRRAKQRSLPRPCRNADGHEAFRRKQH